MLDLLEKGILYNGEVLTIVLFGFICDAPARAFIAYTKTHSGYFSCSKCTEEGDFEGRIVFLNEKAPLRTDATFRSQQQDEHHTGRTILEQLPIDMISTFPLDYMHLCCLGVMLKLLVAQNFCQEFNDYAKQLLVLFVTEARAIYGEKFLSYNVHNLIHLADDVRHFGNLDSFSAFAFEKLSAGD
uniref:DUF4218 domain-containing protein n=1 Tax=Daphnia galeata TaxID=27404 RepID=A0A8J2WUG7_9CRUS|nr:unnamed protein product [Daphnia galeata]